MKYFLQSDPCRFAPSHYGRKVIALSLDAIRQIGEIEQAAQQLVLDAQTKARSIVADAQRDADLQWDAAMKAAAQRAGDASAEAREHAAFFTSRQAAKSRAECDALRARALERMPQAVSIVVEKVVSD